MTLTDSYVNIYGQLPEMFRRLSEGQSPNKFTTQCLKDLGFASTNHRAIIPLLKSLGFLSPDGTPSQRYHAYRDASQSRSMLGQALREAYSDLFTVRAQPTKADQALIEGKFKSTHDTNDRLAKLMTSTSYSLLSIADVTPSPPKAAAELKGETETKWEPGVASKGSHATGHRAKSGTGDGSTVRRAALLRERSAIPYSRDSC
jgi:Family of unknown function (DUF5343)